MDHFVELFLVNILRRPSVLCTEKIRTVYRKLCVLCILLLCIPVHPQLYPIVSFADFRRRSRRFFVTCTEIRNSFELTKYTPHSAADRCSGMGYPGHPTIGKPAISETVRDDGPAPVSYERRFSRRAASGFPCPGKLSEFARLACFEIGSRLLGISHGRSALRRTLGPQRWQRLES